MKILDHGSDRVANNVYAVLRILRQAPSSDVPSVDTPDTQFDETSEPDTGPDLEVLDEGGLDVDVGLDDDGPADLGVEAQPDAAADLKDTATDEDVDAGGDEALLADETSGPEDVGDDGPEEATPDCTGLDDQCNDGVWDGSGCITQPKNDGTTCDDADPCTTSDQCSSGTCDGQLKDCSDGEVCSDDLCIGGTCFNPPISGSCDDGDACTDSDSCVNGACEGGSQLNCDDGSVCTADSCAGGVCQYGPTNNAGSCLTAGEVGVCISGGCAEGMVFVASGSFTMGCAVGDTACYASEFPATAVTFVDPFAIDETEVTVQQYTDCVNGGPCSTPIGSGQTWSTWNLATFPTHPVDYVSWQQASDYCQWRGRRLCSEAEWEYAARGTNSYIFPWGDTFTDLCLEAVATVGGETACSTFFPWVVGSKIAGASDAGALDMAGNVAEWVADCWHATHDGRPTDASVWNLGCTSSERVVKGGDLTGTWQGVRSSRRDPENAIGLPAQAVGIRCCLDGD